MKVICPLIVALATFAAFTGSANGTVQAAGATQTVQAPTPKAITGELQSVDVDDMSFIVKMPNASVETILYNEQTIVVDADKGAQLWSSPWHTSAMANSVIK